MSEHQLVHEFPNRDRDVDAAIIDAEALIRELIESPLPHDPEIEELAEEPVVQFAACPVCDCTSAVPRFAIRDTRFRLVVCDVCGLGSLHPKPTPEAIARFYPPEYYGSAGAKFRPGTEWLVRKASELSARQLIAHLPPGSRVLDVGCGRGVLLSTISNLGMEAHGFEISGTAAQGADPRAKITIADSLSQADYPDGSFDLVVLCHVLEHLPNPRETLLEIHRILKPGGHIAVSVPNFSSFQALFAGEDWFHLDLPRHLYHFPARALRRLLEDTGFRCRSESHFSLRQDPFGWVQSFLNRLSTGPRNGLYAHLKQTGEANSPGSRMIRIAQTAAYWLGMPIGLGLSVLSAVFRSGATITIIAEAGPRVARESVQPAAFGATESLLEPATPLEP